MMEKRIFEKGDFIKYTTYNSDNKFRFGIFEGIDLEPTYQYTKKYSLAAFYDSYKYCSHMDNAVGWGYQPFFEVATNEKNCERTIDTDKEDSWWTICTDEEKEQALQILKDYGYEWNEELLAIVDIETGEIVHKIITPKLEYNGEEIKPINNELKDKLKKSVLSKNKATNYTYPNSNYAYGYHNGCYPYNDDYYYD